MVAIAKPDYTYTWASGGSKITPPPVKIQTGWIAEPPPHEYENWAQNRQDQAIKHIFQRGIAQWDGLTDYEANICYVTGSDGKVYKSVAASGPSSVVQDPVTDINDTYWTIAFATPGSFLTQSQGDTLYARKSLNLSDLPNVSAARDNLSVYSKTEADALYTRKSLNLSDLTSVSVARNNLSVYSKAEIDTSFSPASITGSFSNLKISCTGNNHLVSITADELILKNSTNERIKIIRSISLNANISITGLGGLDVGTTLNNTWYSIWVIYNETTNTQNAILSASLNSPVLPTGYNFKARVGWVRTDNSANKYPLRMSQAGNRVEYKIAPGSNLTGFPILSSGAQGTAPSTWATIGTGNVVPVTASVIKVIATATLQNSNNIAVAPNSSFVSTPGSVNSAPVAVYQSTASAGGGTSIGDIILESSNIFVIANQFSGTSLVLCMGWEDNL